MSGCDYLDNIKGIGFKILLNIFQREDPIAYLSLLIRKKLNETEAIEYEQEVEHSKLSFMYQLVYDEQKELENDKLVNLTPISIETQNRFFHKIDDFTGKRFTNVSSYARGERTLNDEYSIREVKDNEFKKMMSFFSYAPRVTLGCLSNLTERTINYDNFEDFESVIENDEEQQKYFEFFQKTKKETIMRNKTKMELRNKIVETNQTNDTICEIKSNRNEEEEKGDKPRNDVGRDKKIKKISMAKTGTKKLRK